MAKNKKQKISFTVEAVKPRNVAVVEMMGKTGAGVHEKTGKAKRKQAKMDLKRELQCSRFSLGFLLKKPLFNQKMN